MNRICFLDLETTGLDSDRHQIWEIGLIVREIKSPTEAGLEIPGPDEEYLWRIEPDLTLADPNGLRIGRYYERTDEMQRSRMPGVRNLADLKPQQHQIWSDPHTVAAALARILDGSHIVGAVPSFDAEFLKRFLPAHGQAYTAHYHLIDVEALAVGFVHGVMRQTSDELARSALPHDAVDEVPTLITNLPWNSNSLSSAVGINPEVYERHTALGDARWARDQFDAITGHRKAEEAADA